jgi:tetratricopeptide (TPR) repeat protein/predicted Ser/Thr protein kinase
LDSEELRWTEPSDEPEPGTLAGVGIDPDEDGDQDDFLPGTHLGRYVILARQGVGGMGVVYAAYDPQLDRRVALKLMHRRGAGEDEKAARRLLAEAKASAQFSHPNVITVHDVGTWEGRVFLAMEFIEGAPLSKWMREPGRDWQQLLDAFTKAGRGLEAAHEAGLVHRDFKPDNVLVGIDGRVKVLDFGLARRFDGSAEPTERRDREAGTPAYMSPEQHMGRALDHRSDQFSFCVALYEALYGELPFSARTRFELALAVTDGRVGPAPRGAGVPNWVRYALLRGLDPEPEGRWQDMGELLDALARDPHHGLRQLLLGVGATLLVITSGIVLMQVAGDEPEPDEQASSDPCNFGDQRIATVWNPERAEVLRAAFDDVDKPWAKAMVGEVEEGLETWSQGWAAMHRSACEATHVHHVQSDVTLDRRMLCLDRRLAEFDGVITLLSTGGPEVLVRANEAVSQLPALEPCADAQALTTVRDPPLASEEQRLELEALDRELARASTLEFAGDYRQAGELLRDCVVRARALGVQGRLGQALLELGEHELARGDPAGAAPWIDEAIVAAERAGDDPLRARALVAAVQVAADAGSVDEARRRAALARAVLERTGAKGVAYADLAAAEAMTEVAAGHLADAEALLRRAIDDLAAIEPPPIELGDLHAELGVVLRQRGDLVQARAEFELALSSWRERFGDQHPILARARVELAEVALRLGQPEQALGEYQRALALREQAFGPESLEVADTVEGMALVLHALGKHAEALPLHERAKTIYAAQGPSSAEALAQALDDEGIAHRELGQFERAREVHEQARQTWEQALGPNHPTLALALVHLGEDHLLLGQPEQARPWLERALVLLEGHPEPELLDRAAQARFTLARTWVPGTASTSDLALARELAGRARDDYQALGRSERVAELDAWLTEHPPS